MPPCDGIVYEPDSSSYFLYTGAAAASTTKQILYSKKCELTCFVLDINYQSQNTVYPPSIATFLTYTEPFLGGDCDLIINNPSPTGSNAVFWTDELVLGAGDELKGHFTGLGTNL